MTFGSTEENPADAYSSGESVYDNSRTDFTQLGKAGKEDHLIELWRLAYLKSMGASNIGRIFANLHNKVVTFGTTKNINRTRQDIEMNILS